VTVAGGGLTGVRIRESFPDMEEDLATDSIDRRIARRLKALRAERGWSLDRLAGESGVSRATLSRLENAEVSATAAVLGRLCAAFGITQSRLMLMVEDDSPAVVRPADRPVFEDPTVGFHRQSVSPPGGALAGEVVACRLGPGARIDYDRPPRPGLEHHLLLEDGALTVTVGGLAHALSPGDCLRYRLDGPSRFETPAGSGARYLLFLV
jgi:transcriptional regulator with XRE-family HTH domain